MSGLSDKISGKGKQAVGKLTDDRKLQAEGKSEEVIGSLKQKFDGITQTVNEKVDDVKKKLEK